MSDDELVKHMTGLITAGLDRVEQLTAERDSYRKALERIAGVKGPYSHPFPESNEGYGSFAIVTAREALKGEKS